MNFQLSFLSFFHILSFNLLRLTFPVTLMLIYFYLPYLFNSKFLPVEYFHTYIKCTLCSFLKFHFVVLNFLHPNLLFITWRGFCFPYLYCTWFDFVLWFVFTMAVDNGDQRGGVSARATPTVGDSGLLLHLPQWVQLAFNSIPPSQCSPPTPSQAPQEGLETQGSRCWNLPLSLKEGTCHHGNELGPANFMLHFPLETLLGLPVGRTRAKRNLRWLLDLPRALCPDTLLEFSSLSVSEGDLVLRIYENLNSSVYSHSSNTLFPLIK